jgi:hypothetical protein
VFESECVAGRRLFGAASTSKGRNPARLQKMKTYQAVRDRSLHALSLAAVALPFVFTNPAQAQNPNNESLTNTIQTKQQAEALPSGSKVAMVCAKCKTVLLSEVDEKKGFLAWVAAVYTAVLVRSTRRAPTRKRAPVRRGSTPASAVTSRFLVRRRFFT